MSGGNLIVLSECSGAWILWLDGHHEGNEYLLGCMARWVRCYRIPRLSPFHGAPLGRYGCATWPTNLTSTFWARLWRLGRSACWACGIDGEGQRVSRGSLSVAGGTGVRPLLTSMCGRRIGLTIRTVLRCLGDGLVLGNDATGTCDEVGAYDRLCGWCIDDAALWGI